jgi:3D (Asp-Asp-Asp) domain-containing protein
MLLTILKIQFTWSTVKGHRWWWSSCPWKLFDQNQISSFLKKIVKSDTNSLLWTYNITRYYSPVQGQSKYYAWKTYEADVTMNCGKSNIGNDWCLYPSDGIKLTKEDAGKVVACWSQFPKGTKFEIEGYGWVTCRDRGSAIVWKKLDLWMWIWQSWLNSIETTKRPAGDVTIKSILFPWK